MSTIFCCSSITPFRTRQLDHEAKFGAFIRWAGIQTTSSVLVDGSSLVSGAPYAIQLGRQINYGPQESRYFVPASNGADFAEATEDDLLKWDFDKLNSYKNFRCEKHNNFFEINLCKKNSTNLARPSGDIDLAFRRKDSAADASTKVEEPASQEEKQELLSSDIQGKASFPELCTPLSQALQEADEAALQKIQPAYQPDIATLKKVLRFLLPKVGSSLGSSRLLTLLSFDWANAELDLGLELEDLWKAELTSSNIILFLCECFTSYNTSPDLEVNLAEVEDLVIPAMRYVESRRNEQQPTGQARLHEIVNRVLESGYTFDWVSVCGNSIARVFASGPGELLDRSQRRNGGHSRHFHCFGTQGEKVSKAFAPWTRRDEYDDDDFDYDHEPMKDFTACDKECGYCGNCGY